MEIQEVGGKYFHLTISNNKERIDIMQEVQKEEKCCLRSAYSLQSFVEIVMTERENLLAKSAAAIPSRSLNMSTLGMMCLSNSASVSYEASWMLVSLSLVPILCYLVPSNPNLCKKALDIALDAVTVRNVSNIVTALKKEV
eukprot:2801622-Ditylum_brightwellii.AAC.1